MVELGGFFRVLLGKNGFRLVWLINFFNRHQTRLKRLKKHWQQPLSFTRASRVAFRPQLVNAEKSGNNYSQELPRFNRKNGWKSVLLGNLNRLNRNRLRLKQLIPIKHDQNVHDIQLFQVKRLNVILRTLKCKIDFYGYCCDNKVRTTSVIPFLMARVMSMISIETLLNLSLGGVGVKLLLKPWMKGVQKRKVKHKRNSPYLLK